MASLKLYLTVGISRVSRLGIEYSSLQHAGHYDPYNNNNDNEDNYESCDASPATDKLPLIMFIVYFSYVELQLPAASYPHLKVFN